MKRSIRFRSDENNKLADFAEYLRISTLIQQKFDDSDVINLFFHYVWKYQKKNLKIMFEAGYDQEKQLRDILGPFSAFFAKGETINPFNEEEKSEHKTILLNDESENILLKLSKDYSRKSISEIIKTVIFYVLNDAEFVLDILIKLLLNQAFVMISLETIDDKYSFKSAKIEFINMNTPPLNIYKAEYENYLYLINKIKEMKKYDDLIAMINQEENKGPSFAEFIKNQKNWANALKDIDLPKSISPLYLSASKLIGIVAPRLISIKLVSIISLYASLKELHASTLGTYPNIFDKVVSLFLIEEKADRIPQYYSSVYTSLFNTVEEWEKYLESFHFE